MSKQTTRNSKSSSTAATVEKTTGVPDDVVDTTATTSDPSGLRAPDGANSMNTPQSSGDAAGDALADPVKPQVNSDHSETAKVEADNQTPVPAVEALTSGDMSKADTVTVGTDANAGPDAVAADFGRKMRATLIGLVNFGILPATYLGSTDPLRDLAEENARLRGQLAQLDLRADENAASTPAATADELEPGSNHPLTKALLDDWDERREPIVRIVSKVAGFRRGGLAHPAHETDHPLRTLTPDQIEAFLDEENLTVELV